MIVYRIVHYQKHSIGGWIQYVAYRGSKALAEAFAKEIVKDNQVELERDECADLAPNNVLSPQIDRVQLSTKAELLNELSFAASMGIG
ncbi:hypothetical protein [Marinobacter sp.]|uniref:hypothetical protein n=1 Tax=Marinobacter sp. TaxID=50741 RepID=UPI0026210070|nr:hypothetical protein [Marinobacter sp.]